ncbi:Inner membrane ABC transporter permease protein ycjP [uncultured Ruminococcus sp.]|nr:Inner membrane ABC transporter permease protein ycjP [uncultured Ruminococcus sp.]SCI19645.1 Inner membrane ABC transporter permease protein ycjP [uncultured Clostridium sp.]
MGKKKGLSIGKIIVVVFLTIYSLINLYPFLYMILYSFKSSEEIMFTNPFGFPFEWKYENYINAWNNFNIPQYFKSSVVVTVTSTIFVVLFALMFSYAVARMRWKLSSVANTYITMGMFIPVQIILIPLVILVRDMKMSDTYGALILPYTAFQLAFGCMVLYGFMRSLPFELEEAAYIDGAGIFKTFFSVICPLVKPATASVLLFTFINIWNEFTLALVMIHDDAHKTLPVGLATFKGQFGTDWGGMGAAMVIASIPTVIIYLFLGEKLEQALSVSSGVKG